jgi:hypothetical protein
LLPKSDLVKAKKLFMIYKAYDPTKTSFFYNLIPVQVICCLVRVLLCYVDLCELCAVCLCVFTYGSGTYILC